MRASRLALAMACAAGPLRAQCADGTPPPCSSIRRPAAAPAANSVAVLYFENQGRDTADSYLAAGLTEEVILRLQQLPRLEVKSRYVSQRVRAVHDVVPAALGRMLGVRYLVNGTFQRAGDRIVVRVELTRADRGVGIWSERYDQTSRDVLDVIEAIARGVATGVAGRLLPDEVADLARRPTADAVAYEQFLRGNFYLAQRTAPSLARAAEAYEAAVARDPAFKPALARIAYAYVLGRFYGLDALPRDAVARLAGEAAARAVRLAPEVSDAWLAQGLQQLTNALSDTATSLSEARAALARAVTLAPRSAEAHHQFAQVLVYLAEDSLAEVEYRRALELEPRRAVTQQELSLLMLFRGRLAEAVQFADSAAAADPGLPRAYESRALARLSLGDPAGARADAERAVSLAAGEVLLEVRAVHAVTLVATGDSAGGRREAESVVDAPYALGLVSLPFVALGERSRALDVLEALATRAARCIATRWPTLASLRDEARFQRMTAACPWRKP
jgi:TolB-like protein